LTLPSKIPTSDPGSSAGDWLFRQGELVLGPIPAKVLVEKLYAGEVDARTEVSLLGAGNFVRLAEVDLFKLHLAKAQAKQRVDETAKTHRAIAAKTRNQKLVVIAVAAVIVGAGMAGVARYLAVHNPLKQDADALMMAELGISMDDAAPQIRIERARRTETEELVDYPGGPVAPGSTRRADTKTGARAPGRTELASTKPSKSRMSSASSDPDGMQTAEFDQEAINAVVAKYKSSLTPCLVEEVKKKPGMVARIPIEFIIGNDGKVAKVWVDNPDFKNGPLPECLLKTMQRWPFKPYEGERASVGLSFNVGKK